MNQKNKTKLRIVLTGGGTAGHITPLLAVAKEILVLTDGNVDLHYVGQKDDKNAELIEKSGLPITGHEISAGKFRRYYNESKLKTMLDYKTAALNARDLGRVMRGFIGALRIMRSLKPDIVFAKGGYIVVPVGTAARVAGIPYITHDSDVVPGLANKLIASSAIKNAVAVHGITAYPPEKTIVSGIPLSAEYNDTYADRMEYKRRIGIPDSARLLFVYTGTQGAQSIDTALNVVVPSLLSRYPDLYIAHVFGRLNEQTKLHQYEGIDEEYRSRIQKHLFINNAHEFIAASDIIIGRAGATSMAEFAAIGRACIIVPAEQLTGGHQLKNAQLYEHQGAIKLVRESSLPTGLEKAVSELLDNPTEVQALESSIRSMHTPYSAQKIAKLLIDEAQK